MIPSNQLEIPTHIPGNTKVLFVDYDNGHSYKDPIVWYVNIIDEVIEEQLTAAENLQTAKGWLGGDPIRLLRDLGKDYYIIGKGKYSKFTEVYTDIVYSLTIGKY